MAARIAEFVAQHWLQAGLAVAAGLFGWLLVRRRRPDSPRRMSRFAFAVVAGLLAAGSLFPGQTDFPAGSESKLADWFAYVSLFALFVAAVVLLATGKWSAWSA